jgi:hypothetical protein
MTATKPGGGAGDPAPLPSLSAKPKPKPKPEEERPANPYGKVPKSILFVSLLWLLVLVAGFVCFKQIDGFAKAVELDLGPLPFEAVWFGAIGGWLISAQGIFKHNYEWRRSYDYWHYVRPIVGAIVGALGCLIFLVLNEAATNADDKVTTNPTFYAVVALAIGYREESFRSLLSKLLDTIIIPSKESDKTNPEEDKPTTPSGSTGAGGSQPS